jgi:hypothetical protein
MQFSSLKLLELLLKLLSVHRIPIILSIIISGHTILLLLLAVLVGALAFH